MKRSIALTIWLVATCFLITVVSCKCEKVTDPVKDERPANALLSFYKTK